MSRSATPTGSKGKGRAIDSAVNTSQSTKKQVYTPASTGGVMINGGHPSKQDKVTGSVAWAGPAQIAGVNGDHPFGDSKVGGIASGFKLDPTARKVSPLSVLCSSSTADDTTGPVIVSSTPTAKRFGAVGEGNRVAVPLIEKAVFTTDVGSIFMGAHYIKVTNVLATEYDAAFTYLSNELGWSTKLRGIVVEARATDDKYMTAFICFNDTRDAAKAAEQIQASPSAHWVVDYVGFQEYAGAYAKSPKHGVVPSFYDGQVVFEATFKGSYETFSNAGVRAAVDKLAASFGDVMTTQSLSERGSPSWQFRVEFFDITVAERVLNKLAGKAQSLTTDWSVTVRAMGDSQAVKADSPTTAGPASMVLPTPAKPIMLVGETNVSPTGRTAWAYDDKGNMIPAAPRVQLPVNNAQVVVFGNNGDYSQHRASEPFPMGQVQAAQANRAHSYPSRKPNVTTSMEFAYLDDYLGDSNHSPQDIILDNIINGHDVRTTIMVRNVPNQWSLRELKTKLDQSVPGQYDFSYLRVDFQEGTNVGYGFVNFTNAVHLATFVQANQGQFWELTNEYRSKRCAFSYATIQGIDCLISKFRNSSVMLECPDYRPKLWYTAETAGDNSSLIGQEAPFPNPDNAQKHQRSVGNASHVGLYPQRPGFRGIDRMRRSQFDRGTSAQMSEDAMYANATMPLRTIHAPGLYPMQYGGLPSVAYGGLPSVAYGAYNGYPLTNHVAQAQGTFGHYDAHHERYFNNLPRIYHNSSNTTYSPGSQSGSGFQGSSTWDAHAGR